MFDSAILAPRGHDHYMRAVQCFERATGQLVTEGGGEVERIITINPTADPLAYPRERCIVRYLRGRNGEDFGQVTLDALTGEVEARSPFREAALRGVLLVALLVFAVLGTAHAQPADPAIYINPTTTGDTCAATFPARLADSKRAILEYQNALTAYRKAEPAVDWFNQHCRFLSELETTARKLDDPNTMVCDTEKGRPKNLTAKLVLEWSNEPLLGQYVHHSSENAQCETADRAKRISLYYPAGITGQQKLAVVCYEDDSQACVDARAAAAKLVAP